MQFGQQHNWGFQQILKHERFDVFVDKKKFAILQVSTTPSWNRDLILDLNDDRSKPVVMFYFTIQCDVFKEGFKLGSTIQHVQRKHNVCFWNSNLFNFTIMNIYYKRRQFLHFQTCRYVLLQPLSAAYSMLNGYFITHRTVWLALNVYFVESRATWVYSVSNVSRVHYHKNYESYVLLYEEKGWMQKHLLLYLSGDSHTFLYLHLTRM